MALSAPATTYFHKAPERENSRASGRSVFGNRRLRHNLSHWETSYTQPGAGTTDTVFVHRRWNAETSWQDSRLWASFVL